MRFLRGCNNASLRLALALDGCEPELPKKPFENGLLIIDAHAAAITEGLPLSAQSPASALTPRPLPRLLRMA